MHHAKPRRSPPRLARTESNGTVHGQQPTHRERTCVKHRTEQHVHVRFLSRPPTCLYTAATNGFSSKMARLFLSRSRIVNTPPGRSNRNASRKIARDTHAGDSWFTRQMVAKSYMPAGSPVSSAGACRRVTCINKTQPHQTDATQALATSFPCASSTVNCVSSPTPLQP